MNVTGEIRINSKTTFREGNWDSMGLVDVIINHKDHEGEFVIERNGIYITKKGSKEISANKHVKIDRLKSDGRSIQIFGTPQTKKEKKKKAQAVEISLNQLI